MAAVPDVGFNLDESFPSLFLLLLLPIRINNDPAVTSGIPLPLAFHHANSLTPSYAPKTHGFRLDFLLSHTSHHPTKLLRNCYVVYRTRAPCKTSATFFVCCWGWLRTFLRRLLLQQLLLLLFAYFLPTQKAITLHNHNNLDSVLFRFLFRRAQVEAANNVCVFSTCVRILHTMQ